MEEREELWIKEDGTTNYFGYYALNEDGTTRPTNNIREAFDEERKRAQQLITEIDSPQGHFTVSTVFLGLNHQFGDGPPLIFETMIFPDFFGERLWTEVYCERYSTIEEAKEGHAVAVHYVEQALLEFSDEP